MAQYFTKPEVVAECLALLRKERIHPNFAGYLCLKRASSNNGIELNLRSNFKEFFDSFLRVPDAPSSKPYAMPFCDTAPSEANKWFNSNVAGSYAPSSIRAGSPFDRVVKAETGQGKKPFYSLNDNHWELAYAHLGFGKKIPVVPLAVFLYRDFAVEVENEPTTRDLVEIFRDEFGYTSATSQRADIEFQYLYFDDSDSEPHPEWFEANL